VVGWVDTGRAGVVVMNSEMRDNGPYLDSEQVQIQYANWSTGMKAGGLKVKDIKTLLIREALMIAGVEVSEHERAVLVQLAGCTRAQAQVLAGWLIRAAHPQAASLPESNR
jgi:hypothetical protein